MFTSWCTVSTFQVSQIASGIGACHAVHGYPPSISLFVILFQATGLTLATSSPAALRPGLFEEWTL